MRLRVLPAVALALVILLAVFLASLRTVQQSRLDEVRVNTAERAGELVRVELDNRTDAMGAALESLTREPSLKAAMRAGDKKSLAAIATPIFEQLKSKFHIEHLYVHSPDRVNVIRAHDPEHDGDLIDRVSLETAQSTGLPSSGIEQGPTGNCTLRVVYPWRDGETLLGYLELGTEFENVADRVNAMLGVEVVLVVDKRYLNHQRWEQRNQKLGRQSKWADFADVVVIDTTVRPIPPRVEEALAASPVRIEPFNIEADDRSTQVVFLPLDDIAGRHLGHIVILSDTTAIVSQGKRTTYLVTAVCLAIGLAMLAFFWFFLGRIEKELDKRAARLKDANAGLERRVEERTAKLDARNRDMRFVLDHVDSGLLTLDRAGNIGPEWSAAVERWFGAPTAGTNFGDFIQKVDTKAGTWVKLGLEALSEDFLPIELVLSQLPKQFKHADRSFRMSFDPVYKDGELASVFVLISDMTSDVERTRSEQAAHDIAALIQRVVTDRQGVVEFIAETDALVRTVTSGAAPTDEVKRAVHTLKGNCGIYGVDRLADLCNRMEESIADTEAPAAREIAEMRELWARLTTMLNALVGDRSRARIEVERRDVDGLLSALDAGAPKAELIRRAAQLKLSPTARRLEQLADQGRALAGRLAKPDVEFVVEDNGVRLDPEAWSPFWGSFIHLVRNAVDHGIEDPAEREAAKKDGGGRVVLRTVMKDAHLLVEIEDDGRGIDLENVATRAKEAGLPHANERDAIEAIFHDGLSTKHEASDISGRGVGLSAVRAASIGLGGTVDVHTRPGAGTRVRFTFPTTGAMRAM